MALVWREQMSVGNNLIDNDHKQLIDIINKVEESLAQEDKRTLGQMFDELSKYSQDHFKREEKLAKEVGYAKADKLHKAHNILVEKLEKYKLNAVERDWGEESIDDFCALLRSWLIDHVIKEDMLMKPYLVRFHPDYKGRVRW